MSFRLILLFLALTACRREPVARSWPLLELPGGDSDYMPFWWIEDSGTSLVQIGSAYGGRAARESIEGSFELEALYYSHPTRASCSKTECIIIGTNLRFAVSDQDEVRPSRAWPLGRRDLLVTWVDKDAQVHLTRWAAPGIKRWDHDPDVSVDRRDWIEIGSDAAGSRILVSVTKSVSKTTSRIHVYSILPGTGEIEWRREFPLDAPSTDYPIFVSSDGTRAILGWQIYHANTDTAERQIMILDAASGSTVSQLGAPASWSHRVYPMKSRSVVDVAGGYLWWFDVSHDDGESSDIIPSLSRPGPSFGCGMNVYRLSDGKHILGENRDDYQRVFGKHRDGYCHVRAVRPHPNGLMTSAEIVDGHIRLMLRRAIPPF